MSWTDIISNLARSTGINSYTAGRGLGRALNQPLSSRGPRKKSSVGGGGGFGTGFGDIVGGLMDTINNAGQQARAYTQSAAYQQPGGAPSNPIDALRQQLYAAMNQQVDTGELRSQASAQAQGIYGPQVQALRDLMQRSEQEAAKNKVEIGRMFAALSSGIRADIPRIEENTKRGKADIQKDVNAERGTTENLYKSIEKEQTDEMERLGIQAAAPDVIPGQNKDRAFFDQLARTQGRQTQDYLDIIGQGSEEFTRQGAQLANLEGTQRKADVGTQLSDILFGYRQNITQLKGQKAAAVQEIYNQLAQGASQAKSQNIQNLMGLTNFEQQERAFTTGEQHWQQEMALKAQKDQANKTKASYSGMRGAAQVALDYFAQQPQQAQKVTNWVNNYLLNQGVQQIRPGERFDPITVAQKAYQEAAKAGFIGGSLNAIRDAVLAYYGKY